ncbi:MAG: hypothetical protein ACTSXU_07755, partial [Promethearchaeota archaeon]
MASRVLFIQPQNVIEGIPFEREFPVHLVYLANFIKYKMKDSIIIKFLDLAMERFLKPSRNYLDCDVISDLIKKKLDEFPSNNEKNYFIVISCFNSYHYIPTMNIL